MTRYICTHNFRDIKQGSIVEVEILSTTVSIIYNKRTSYTNMFILDLHFEKEE